jgi:glycosyltransferase involved in cell wall biosynthesis
VEELLGAHTSGVIAHPGGDRLGSPLKESEIIARVRQGGPLRLVFLGHVIPRKGLDGLLAALTALSSRSWELFVIGNLETDPVHVAKIRQHISASGLENKVQLLGSVSDAELAQLLTNSHVMAMPFSYEGFGIVYLEGMAYGLPGLACRSGGAGEIVRHGETGYLLEPGDIAGLVILLEWLMENRNELLNLSLAARRCFDEFPTWEQTAAKIRDFLLRAVHAKA